MKKIIITCLFLAAVYSVNAQNADNNKTFPAVICEYTLPVNRNGLSVTAFSVKPYIYLNRFEKSANIILEIKKEQGTAQNPNPSFKYSYNYNGKQYDNESLGHGMFNNITASGITYEVLVTYGPQSWGWTKVDGSTNQFGPIDKNAKASEINVRVKVVGIGSFSGTSAIERKIKLLLQPQKSESTTSGNNLSKVKDQQVSSSNSPSSGITKQSVNNTFAPAYQPNVYTAPKTTSSTSTPLSQKVKLNGQDVQVYQQGGKYYVRNSDGSEHETQKIVYDKVTTVANNNSIAAKNVTQQEANRVATHQLAQETQRQAHEQAQAAKAARAELTAQVVTQAASLAGELFSDWQANRERRWAQERAQEENRKSTVTANKIAYSQLVTNTNQYLFESKDNYLKMLEANLPATITSAPFSWENIIGTKAYNKIFGFPKSKKRAGNKVDAIQIPNLFSNQLITKDTGTEFYYWVKNDFYPHANSLLYNKDQICVGLTIDLRTDVQEDQIHIKDYYDGLAHNLKSKYIMLNGNTFATYDKLFVLEFDKLTIFDLNFLDPNTTFLLPKEFRDTNNDESAGTTINQLGIKIIGTPNSPSQGVEVAALLPNTITEKQALLAGDIIEKVNDVQIKSPYHLQWFFYAYPNEKALKTVIRRQNKTEAILINLN